MAAISEAIPTPQFLQWAPSGWSIDWRAGATGRHLHAGAYETVIYQLATKLLEANAEVQLLRVGLVAWRALCYWETSTRRLRYGACWNSPP